MVVPDDPAVSEWGTYMSMLTQELSSVPVVTQSMGSPSDYAGTSSPAGPSVSSEQDDEPEADSMLNNEHVDSEPDEVEVEGLTTNNPENNDEVSIEVMIDVLGNTASGSRSQRQDDFDLNMHVSCEPTNLYSVIPFFEAMHPEKLNPGTVVEWLNLETDRPGVQMLHYVFWAFRPCIEGFRSYRNVISVDGTHLYTKYKHKLLVAVTLDANQQVLPLAFALVDKESLASWRWFLQLLAKHLLPNDDDQDLCWRAGAEVNARKFERIMTEIRELNEEAYNWLRMIDKTQWTLSHDSGWRTVRYFLERTTRCHRMLNANQEWADFAFRIFEALQAEAGSHTYVVKLKHKTCSCGKWGTHGIPCSHAIQEEYWDPVDIELVHNPAVRVRRGPGRYVSTRIPNEIDRPQARARQQYQSRQV
ncbi:hypothetical protein Sango_1728700 [Sesamum angolense]|uniref:SWIM-type domain-containing protein n=1 Tax=Sesamum angolense TaxID=2727404 RepID=A0AAE1WM55_9LAMI|nr:hypothetical protein Sango_1728700 [Sesamum angolense]